MFVVPVKALKDAVKLLKKVVPTRASVPVLSNVLFNPIQGTVTGTDLEQNLIVSVGAKSQSRPFVVPLAELVDILKNLKTGELTFDSETAPNSVLVKFKAGDVPMERRIEALPVNDWPSMEIDKPVLDSVQADESFFEMFRSASQLVSRDATREVLRHVCVDKESIAAGNGRIQVAFEHGLSINHEFLLPASKLLTANGGLAGEATIQTYGKDQPEYCTVYADTFTYTAKLFQAAYPNYRQVFPDIDPEDRVIRIEVESKETLTTVLSQFHIHDKTNKPVTLLSGEYGCHVIGEGETPEVVAVQADVKGPKDPMVASVNRDYLTYVLEAGFSEIRMKGAMKPITAANCGSKVVFMPIRGGRSVEDCLKLIGSANTTSTIVEGPQTKEQETVDMPTEQKTQKPNLSVVNNETTEKQVDPFDELIAFAGELTDKAKELNTLAKELPKKVRALKSNLKQKDKAFAQAQQAMEQLRKVSGF